MTDRIALSLKQDFTNCRWVWSLVGESFRSTGAVAAHDREDAVLCALAAAYESLRARGPVQLVLTLPPTARLWAYAPEVSTHFAGVTVVPYTESDAAIRTAAMRGLAPAPVSAVPSGPLIVATDGSASRGRIGWGWLAGNGRHGYGTDQPSVLACVRRSQPLYAELRAISHAIAALPDRDLVIRTDCRRAIGLIEEWVGGGDRLPEGYAATHHAAAKRGGLVWMQEQVRKEAHRLDIGWVRGHAGDALNEGADSLAKLPRRAAEGTWGFGPDDIPARAHAIADAFAGPDSHSQPATAA